MMTVLFIISAVFLAAVLLQIKPASDSGAEMEQILPIWKVENDCILSKKGDVTVAFKVTLPEIFSLSSDEYDSLHHNWLKAIKVLPYGSVLHKQDWFIKSKYEPRYKDDNLIMQASDQFFNERPFLSHDCYLMITLKGPDRKPSSSALSTLLRKNIVPPELKDSRRMEKLLEVIGQFKRILSDGGLVQLEQLTEQEIVGSKAAPGILEQYLYLGSGQNGPELSDVSFKPEWKVGTKTCRLYSMADVEDLPGAVGPRIHYDPYSTDRTRFSVGFATPVGLLLPTNHIYNQYMVIGDPAATYKRLEGKRRRLQSLSAYSRENAIGRDATQDFLNEAISEARTPIRAHFNVLCWTDEPSQVKEMQNLTASALAKMNIVPHQETDGAPQLWWSGIPGNAADLPENDTFESFAEPCSCFLNMETAYRSSKSPFGIRLGDRLSGTPVHVDVSDELMGKVISNRNKVVVGSSGAGKSMFMCHLLHSYVQQFAHCVVVDVGHSYSGLCLLLGGYYYTYSEEDPIRFNPFYIPAGDVLDTEKKESIKTLLVALWKQSDERFRRSEYVAISNALQSYYLLLDKRPDIFPCFNTFYEFLQEHFVKELEADKVKDRDFDMANFLYVLRPFYSGGEFDYLLNARENLDVLQQPFIVFELDSVKDHPILFQIITLIICELFISKMRKLKGIRKVIVIEEAWKAIAKSGMAEFMKYLYKTIRKYFGEAITVTQEIDDIISSPIIKEAIINNADCKIILDMKKFQNKFEAIQQVLGMTDKGRDLVLSINRANEKNRNYREVYIELGNQLMKVYRYEPSPQEYFAYTTEQPEKMKLQSYIEKYGSIEKALRVLAAEFYEQHKQLRA
ncbi:TraG family conjugative transposon ATPase [Sphingobacterium thalpophilum]|uniref:TraG family conjugative transposon ATPase n=1 Tax=Sphingobacterium thalpophilum TaxID=259 RepID=UPI003D9893F2